MNNEERAKLVNDCLLRLPSCKVAKNLPQDIAKLGPYVTPKLDGFSCIVASYGEGYDVVSRNGKSLNYAVRNSEDFKRLQIPQGVAVQFELYLPNGRSSDVATAVARASGELRLLGLSILTAPPSLPLENMLFLFSLYKVLPIPIVASSSNLVTSCPLRYLKASNDCKAFEGYVFREANLTGFVKYKESYTADLRVIGTIPGKGKYTGLVGALKVANAEGVEVASVSGMTDLQRAEFTAMLAKGSLIGLLVEVEYQEVGAKGKLRFPRFKRIRIDKDEVTKGADL